MEGESRPGTMCVIVIIFLWLNLKMPLLLVSLGFGGTEKRKAMKRVRNKEGEIAENF